MEMSTVENDAPKTFQSSLVMGKSCSACWGCGEMCKRNNDLADRCPVGLSYAYVVYYFFYLFYLSICHTQSHGNSVYTHTDIHRRLLPRHQQHTHILCHYGDSKYFILFICGYICIHSRIHICSITAFHAPLMLYANRAKSCKHRAE